MTCFINIKTSNILLKVENKALARKSYTSNRRFYIINFFAFFVFLFFETSREHDIGHVFYEFLDQKTSD